ncbi:MAG: phosphate regulon sensor histidine kinase PhoR [Alphaproteobacteria bacterium]|nr:phosphate regulon sensor histidine kinase PhoR [Alphaproteobacteria bacterium]
MATPNTKHIVTTTLAFAAPAIVALAVLVAIGALAIGPAIVAAVAVLLAIAAFAARPVGRLQELQQRIDAMVSGGRVTSPDGASEALTDPGGGAIGDVTAAFQRFERNWHRDRKALTDGLGAAATLFDALPDPLVTLDRQSRLVYANAAARALLAEGRPEDDIRGRDLSAVLRQPLVLEAVSEVQAGAATRAVEFTFADRVDQTFEARVETIGGTEVSDNDAFALLLLRDVTAQRQSEQSRADFVANVSHELRTPLTSLIGFIETLRDTAKEDPAARDRFLALMATQSDRMARLVDDLLSLSRIEMNEHTPPDEAVDLRHVIGTVTDLLAPQARQRNITIDTQLDPVTGPIAGDADELVQLFQNLIENAIKYAHEGTTVRIVAERASETATISIIDQGDGIASEHLARLTERFYRIDTARSRELGGTGLGLAIVKHIVNRHRGDLAITSTEGEGSTFAVTLQYAAPPIIAADETKAASAD